MLDSDLSIRTVAPWARAVARVVERNILAPLLESPLEDLEQADRQDEELPGVGEGPGEEPGVRDARMDSAENRRTPSLGRGQYILSSRPRAGDEVTEWVLTPMRVARRWRVMNTDPRRRPVFRGCCGG